MLRMQHTWTERILACQTPKMRLLGQKASALEGTGSFAAGFAQTLAEAGETVVEVGAVKRARGAKNDRLDAVRAPLARRSPVSSRLCPGPGDCARRCG
jgi:hypothetical protein